MCARTQNSCARTGNNAARTSAATMDAAREVRWGVTRPRHPDTRKPRSVFQLRTLQEGPATSGQLRSVGSHQLRSKHEEIGEAIYTPSDTVRETLSCKPKDSLQ